MTEKTQKLMTLAPKGDVNLVLRMTPPTGQEEKETVRELDASQTTRIKKSKKNPAEVTDSQLVCDFCGCMFVNPTVARRTRKYCSVDCQNRASRGRRVARLALPPKKRQVARLKFSNPLYFN